MNYINIIPTHHAIHVIILIIIIKVSLKRLDFIGLLMVKLKRSLKNLELDINVAKNGPFRVFPRQATNSAANGEFHGTANFTARHGNPRAVEYCWPCTLLCLTMQIFLFVNTELSCSLSETHKMSQKSSHFVFAYNSDICQPIFIFSGRRILATRKCIIS